MTLRHHIPFRMLLLRSAAAPVHGTGVVQRASGVRQRCHGRVLQRGTHPAAASGDGGNGGCGWRWNGTTRRPARWWPSPGAHRLQRHPRRQNHGDAGDGAPEAGDRRAPHPHAPGRTGWACCAIMPSATAATFRARRAIMSASARGRGGACRCNACSRSSPSILRTTSCARRILLGHAARGVELAIRLANDPAARSMNVEQAAARRIPSPMSGDAGGGAAWCTATSSKPFWDDYVLTAAVQPALDGAVGVLVNMTGPGYGLLVRWTRR